MEEEKKPEEKVQKEVNDVKTETVEPKKKKGKKGLVIFIVLLLALIIAAACYYFFVYTKPEQMFKNFIGRTYNSYQKAANENKDYKTLSATIDGKLEVKPDEDYDGVDEKVIDLINNIDLSINTEMDREDKILNAKIKSNYDDEKLLNINLYADSSNKISCIYAKDLLDKYIKADVDDATYELLDKAFENSYKETNFEGFKIFINEIKGIIKPEYCNKESQKIVIDGKEVAVQKNTIEMTCEQIKTEMEKVIKNLKENEKFINSFENPDEIEDNLEKLIKKFENTETSNSDMADTKINIAVYTTGLLQKVVRVDFALVEKEKVGIAVTKSTDEKYLISALKESEEKNIGSISVNKKDEKEYDLEIKFDIESIGTIKLTLATKYDYNTEIEKIDEDEIVNANELTQSDMNDLMKNLQKSKIYELISDFSKNMTSKNNGFQNAIEEENEENYYDDENESLSTSDNEIATYDNKMKIQVSVPSGYKLIYGSDYTKEYTKDKTSVSVRTKYGTVEEYEKSLDTSKEYYNGQEYYKDVNLSEAKSLEVNGRKFKSRTLEYKYVIGNSSYDYKNIYFYSELSDDNLIVIEIQDKGEMTNSELEQFLTINVK